MNGMRSFFDNTLVLNLDTVETLMHPPLNSGIIVDPFATPQRMNTHLQKLILKMQSRDLWLLRLVNGGSSALSSQTFSVS
jgi:hypothetical protein